MIRNPILSNKSINLFDWKKKNFFPVFPFSFKIGKSKLNNLYQFSASTKSIKPFGAKTGSFYSKSLSSD